MVQPHSIVTQKKRKQMVSESFEEEERGRANDGNNESESKEEANKSLADFIDQFADAIEVSSEDEYDRMGDTPPIEPIEESKIIEPDIKDVKIEPMAKPQQKSRRKAWYENEGLQQTLELFFELPENPFLTENGKKSKYWKQIADILNRGIYEKSPLSHGAIRKKVVDAMFKWKKISPEAKYEIPMKLQDLLERVSQYCDKIVVNPRPRKKRITSLKSEDSKSDNASLNDEEMDDFNSKEFPEACYARRSDRLAFANLRDEPVKVDHEQPQPMKRGHKRKLEMEACDLRMLQSPEESSNSLTQLRLEIERDRISLERERLQLERVRLEWELKQKEAEVESIKQNSALSSRIRTCLASTRAFVPELEAMRRKISQ